MKFKILVVLLLLLIPFGISAQEQEDLEVHKLEELVVTSTNSATLIDTPASISVITADDLKRMGVKNIAEAFSKIPGVTNTSAKNPSISIRGSKSSMAGGALILLDGVPVKLGVYRYDQFDFISVSQIERVEILKTSGVSAGAGSSRGVINIVTKKTKKDIAYKGSVSLSYGSWNTINESANIFGSLKKWDYLFSATNDQTDGYEEEEKKQSSAMTKLGYELSDSTRIGFSFNMMLNDHDTSYGIAKYQYQLDNFRQKIHFNRSETNTDLVWHNSMEKDVKISGIDFSHIEEKFAVKGYFSYTDYNEIYYDTKDIYYSTYTSRGDITNKDQDSCFVNLSTEYTFNIGEVVYTPSFGMEYESIKFEERVEYPYDLAGTKSSAKYDINMNDNLLGVYFDNDILFGNSFALKAGVRSEQSSTDYKDKQSDPYSFDQERTLTSWSIAPSYYFNNNANIYYSLSSKFWLPTPKYYAWAIQYDYIDVNTLKPEETITSEIGYKQKLNELLNISSVVYYAEHNNKFSSVYEGTSFKGISNVGSADSKGFELEVDGKINKYIGYRFSYGYIDYLNRLEYPSKTTYSSRISYKLSSINIWVLGKNIFDQEIERAFNSKGELTEPNGSPKTYYYVQDGAYFELGIAYNF